MTVKTKLITAAMLLGSINPTTSSLPKDEKDNKAAVPAKDKIEVVDDNQPQPLPKHLMQPGKMETGNARIDEKISQMRKAGAFYLDYRKYRETHDVRLSIVYFTNEEIDNKGLNKLPMTPFAVSRARENGLMWQDDAWKNPEAMAQYKEDLAEAVSNIKGTFNGIFQFSNANIAKAVLYGLMQRRNPELQEFCRRFVRPGVDVEKHQGFQKFRNSYLQAVEKFDNGEGTRQDLMQARFGWILDKEFDKPGRGIFSVIDYSKDNFHKLSLQNPEMSLQMQETFAVNVYMVLSVHSEKIFNHLDPMTLGTIFAAMIHVPNDSKTVDVLIHNSPEKAREELIRIHGEPTKADDRMWEASKKVNNQGFYGSTFVRNFAWITDNPKFWNDFMCGVRAMAEQDMVKDYQTKNALITPWFEQAEVTLLEMPKIVAPQQITVPKLQQKEEQKTAMKAFWQRKQKGRK